MSPSTEICARWDSKRKLHGACAMDRSYIQGLTFLPIHKDHTIVFFKTLIEPGDAIIQRSVVLKYHLYTVCSDEAGIQ